MRPLPSQLTQRGTITLLLLVLMIMLILILSTSLQLISQQTHQTVDQQHKLQIVDVADAGVQYAAWLLSPTGGNFTPQTLQANPPAGATNHVITDSDNHDVGVFTLAFPTACMDRLQVLSLAQDSNQPGLCQSVEATIQQDTSGIYRVTQWDQLVNTACTGVTVSSPLICPTPAPTPTLTPLPM